MRRHLKKKKVKPRLPKERLNTSAETVGGDFADVMRTVMAYDLTSQEFYYVVPVN